MGFDWEDRQDVWKKVHEELAELEDEMKKSDQDTGADETLKQEQRLKTEGELGDFLFAIINAARLYKLNPDNALEMTNQKFIRRFNYIEQHSIKMGKPLTEMTLAEMDELWDEAKEQENNSKI